MGRGSSKAGGNSVGGGSTSGVIANNVTVNEDAFIKQSPAEKAIYEVGRTAAFPSKASVVKRVPELQDLENAMKSAPDGTMLGFNVAFRGVSGVETEKWIYEKTGANSWKATIIKPDGSTRAGGSYKGIKALQSISDKKYRTTYYDGEGIKVKEYNILKNAKKK